MSPVDAALRAPGARVDPLLEEASEAPLSTCNGFCCSVSIAVMRNTVSDAFSFMLTEESKRSA